MIAFKRAFKSSSDDDCIKSSPFAVAFELCAFALPTPLPPPYEKQYTDDPSSHMISVHSFGHCCR